MSSSSPALPVEIGGVEVATWVTLGEFAEFVGRSRRTVQRWMARGLPHHGAGPDLAFPLPQAFTWSRYFVQEISHDGRGESGRVPFPTALAWERAQLASWEFRERKRGSWE